MLEYGLALGGFTPAVTEKAILKPPGRESTAFVAALVEAAEQCVEVLVTLLKFKLSEVPQQSASEYRTSDKRAREDNDENEEEEQADDAVFEEGEEVATVPPVNKKGKGSAAMFTAVGVSLASYGVPEAEHRQYMQHVEAVGAVVSPPTERADKWAQAAWGLPGADAVVRGIATGFSWQQAEPEEFFRVENYVPPQHEEKGVCPVCLH
ncbi:hypothetical protein CYMTET_22989 [Cymbomonas tetramitiformis]|uniref:Uncharacterized protein n=1 Tax=Cymbomonas tetramitiformis TaxID=36881 RepID=A0AAE0FYU7_9CHLO|nr:hypothetical protein CYMTET_22989 [Cymbomonas tetramitiformis]